MHARTLQEAAEQFLNSIDAKSRLEIGALVLNSRIEPARRWMDKVIKAFCLDDEADELIADIDRQYPDESSMKEIESESGKPLFEAKMILREVQRMIRSGAGVVLPPTEI